MRGEELIFDCGKKTIVFLFIFLNSTDVLKEEEEEERQ